MAIEEQKWSLRIQLGVLTANFVHENVTYLRVSNRLLTEYRCLND